jgi:hypothetical protein
VVSTRESQTWRLSRDFLQKPEAARRLSRMNWVDVGSDQLKRYFRVANRET